SGSTSVMVTAAIPNALRSRVPAKITSSMRAPRRLLADCSPSTQLMASLRLDFPHPFGPTTAAIPPPCNLSSVRSQKDLNPCTSTRLSLNKLLPRPFGGCHYTKRGRAKSKAPSIHHSGFSFLNTPYIGLRVPAFCQKRSDSFLKVFTPEDVLPIARPHF